MGKLYDIYEKLKLDSNIENNMKLIYTLVAIETNLNIHYGIEKGHEFNQFWLNKRVKGSKGEDIILLQATQWNTGKVDLSIHGLNMIEEIKDFIDCNDKAEHDIFMKYLKYF
ncbi:hypothetical protein [uncultured Clostridium sp.]|uniref:hypothetical protein n=1 Tax=uncultured Clostridium sp. TaxID=59620 RepID=UPI0028EBDC86|nr:hypothetical protein [uncultured Clostridium sp.]